MNKLTSPTKTATLEPPENDSGDAGAGDGDAGGGQSATPAAAAGKLLVFEQHGEFARQLLCYMFETGAMADVEVIIDDSCSIRSHAEVLVRVSGYFKTLLQGNQLIPVVSSYRYHLFNDF